MIKGFKGTAFLKANFAQEVEEIKTERKKTSVVLFSNALFIAPNDQNFCGVHVPPLRLNYKMQQYMSVQL